MKFIKNFEKIKEPFIYSPKCWFFTKIRNDGFDQYIEEEYKKIKRYEIEAYFYSDDKHIWIVIHCGRDFKYYNFYTYSDAEGIEEFDRDYDLIKIDPDAWMNSKKYNL